MKVYEKDKLVLQGSLFSVMQELDFFKKVNSESRFIVYLKYAFQDREAFYLVEELCEGGDLRTVMNKIILTENKAKFILACVIVALEFLHYEGYAFRDLKPENILIDKHGYVKLGDFKLLREISTVNFHDTTGTKGYMAPEIILNQNHGCASDIFSLGVIAFELMLGKLPYSSGSIEEYKKEIIKDIVLIKNSDLPEGWSQESADFINKCILRRPITRIGYNSIEEIKDHKWFIDIDWVYIKQKAITPPYNPGRRNNFTPRIKDTSYYNLLEYHNLKNLELYIEDLEVQGFFIGYYYDDLYKKFLERTSKFNVGGKKYKQALEELIAEEKKQEGLEIVESEEKDEVKEENSGENIINISKLNSKKSGIDNLISEQSLIRNNRRNNEESLLISENK